MFHLTGKMFNQSEVLISNILRKDRVDRFCDKRHDQLQVPSLSLGTRSFILLCCFLFFFNERFFCSSVAYNG